MAKPVARPNATDNLMLLLALVPFVLDKGEVSVGEAAAQFGRTEDDIVRAVELIACAGIPGENLAYSHLDLFDIDWDLFESEKIITFWNTVALDQQPRFSAREASALLAGLQYLQAHPAYAGRSDVEEVIDKIKRGSGSGPSDRIAVGAPALKQHLGALSESVENKVSVRIRYHNKRGEVGSRLIDPIVLEARDATWYVRAWCHERRSLRTFRVDHIESLEVTDHAHESNASLIEGVSASLFDPSPGDVQVTLEVAPGALPLIADYLPRGYQTKDAQSTVVLEIPFAHYGSLTNLVAQNPHTLSVLKPLSARQAVHDFARSALQHYRA